MKKLVFSAVVLSIALTQMSSHAMQQGDASNTQQREVSLPNLDTNTVAGNDFIQAAKAVLNEWQRDYPEMAIETLFGRGNLHVDSAKMVIFGNSDLIKKYIDEQKRIANDEIKKLNLANNLLEVIPSDFSQLFGTTITELNLSNNKIKEIKSEAFNGLNDLQFLYLNKNNLTELDPSLFSDLRSLSFINLSDNPLKQESIDALRKALPRIRIDF